MTEETKEEKKTYSFKIVGFDEASVETKKKILNELFFMCGPELITEIFLIFSARKDIKKLKKETGGPDFEKEETIKETKEIFDKSLNRIMYFISKNFQEEIYKKVEKHRKSMNEVKGIKEVADLLEMLNHKDKNKTVN